MNQRTPGLLKPPAAAGATFKNLGPYHVDAGNTQILNHGLGTEHPGITLWYGVAVGSAGEEYRVFYESQDMCVPIDANNTLFTAPFMGFSTQNFIFAMVG